MICPLVINAKEKYRVREIRRDRGDLTEVEIEQVFEESWGEPGGGCPREGCSRRRASVKTRGGNKLGSPQEQERGQCGWSRAGQGGGPV